VEPLSCVSLRTVRLVRGLSGNSIFLGPTRILFDIDHISGGQTGPAHAAQVSCCGQTPQRTRGNMGG
jgi:hypothetical protein